MRAVTLFLGPAGSGKSRALRERLNAAPEPRTLLDASDGEAVYAWIASASNALGTVAIDGLEALDGRVVTKLVAAIERCDGRLQWLLASRSRVGLPIATWSAKGTIAIVGVGELRVAAEDAEEPDWAEGWAVAVALRSRELVHAFLEERAYPDLDGDELSLLEAASVLPDLDTSVLEDAGFDGARRTIERIAARTSLVRGDGERWGFSHPAIGDSLRRRVASMPHAARTELYGRLARTLETRGNDRDALEAYAAAGNREALVGLLRERGFDLLDAGCIDAVLRAIEALDGKMRREDAGMLALRGAAHASKGRPARAEALLRRGLERAGADGRLRSTITLRLALLLANRSDDVRELLEPIANDDDQPSDLRAEALSLIAAQRAVSGDAKTASAAVERVRVLLPAIDRDIARAKVLQRIGVAAVNTGDADGAQRALEEAADLATELELFSLASRAYASLATLTRQHRDDTTDELRFAEGATEAAIRGGDQFDIENALLQKLIVAVRRGDFAESESTAHTLTTISTKKQRTNQYVVLFQAIRYAWQGNFGVSHRLLGECRSKLHFPMERLQYSALFALLLELDNNRDASTAAVTQTWSDLSGAVGDCAFSRRQLAIGLLYVAIARALHGKFAHAESALTRIKADDAVLAALERVGRHFVDQARRRFRGTVEPVAEDLRLLALSGYVEVVSILESITDALIARRNEKPDVLSPAERTVLRLLNEGLATKQIAARTGRSIFTVRAHIANAIGKLKCHGRNEALAEARRLHLVP
ncbi:MAG: hypothetical protein JO104_12465 [Candidatus Eremiobacteraeota bacterium]|nr:hypothetical protein [Candidatus Eremiobacteraeota bacterium]